MGRCPIGIASLPMVFCPRVDKQHAFSCSQSRISMSLENLVLTYTPPMRFQPSRAVGCPTRYPNMASRDADAKLG
ncbi:hypothetical protein H9L39_03048 [Fusarium oxysporum f. sp. albedinis]|nr:hypothetical protein H9L39_03048 [Fusarium oxysporum f. sp. albedinis]